MYQGGTELLVAHALDHLEPFTNDWIDWLQNPDDMNQGNYNGPRCPFSKKAKDDGRMKLVKVYDYFSAYDFWEVVSKECDKFDGSKDIVIVAAQSDADKINPDQMSGGVDGLNTFLNQQGRDLWLLTKIDQMFTIVMIQKISALDDTSKQLEAKGYYIGRYTDAMMEKVVTGRRKYRERL